MLTLILSLIGTPCQSLDYTITPFHSNAPEGGNFCLHHKKVCDKNTHHAFLDFKAEVTQTFENCL